MSVIERLWEWRFSPPPHLLWPVLADTARLNEAIGLPRYTVAETPLPDGSVRRVGNLRRFGVTVAWEEVVPQWIAPRRFYQERRFLNGPLRRLAAEITLDPQSGDDDNPGSLVRYRLVLERRWPGIGSLLRLGFLPRFGRRLDRLYRDAAAGAVSPEPHAWAARPQSLPSASRERLAVRASAIAAQGYPLAERLAAHLAAASDNDVERMRPRVLARRWGDPAREVIETCLAAAREGVLTLRWDLICPRCRGAKATVGRLDELPKGAHCPSCNVPFDRDFSRNVEITFDPAPDIRPVPGGTFCIASPLAAEHILVQRRLGAGEAAMIDAGLADGDYRARTVEPGGAADFAVRGGAAPEIRLTEAGPTRSGDAAPGLLRVRNDMAVARTLVIEDRRWSADALTAPKSRQCRRSATCSATPCCGPATRSRSAASR